MVRIAEEEVTPGRATLDDLVEAVANNADLDGAEQAHQRSAIKLVLARRDPVVTTGDPTLVELALTNALRNAVEAALAVPEDNQGDVILNWGVTDTDNWIVVLDEGCGLPMGWDRLTKPGVTTKSKIQGHLGMGLPIAERAIESMQGSFRLTPRSGSGVSCEIRWPRGGFEE